jgi:hypothetical protein
MAEILNILPPDILQVETPQHLRQQEAVVPAKPDDDGTNPAVIDALFSEKQEKKEEITPAMLYALWSGAGLIGDKARDVLKKLKTGDQDEDDLDPEEPEPKQQ